MKKIMIQYEINHMDPLGQGVSKIGEKITFIPKSLPGEKGEAEVYKESKGVRFAKALTRTQTSDVRTFGVCPHFEACYGCHYLHTDYENELLFKKNNLTRTLQNLAPLPRIFSHPSPKRLYTRNRLQLHYIKNVKALGLINPIERKITPIPECKLPLEEVGATLASLYENSHWLSLLPSHSPNKGHLEIYLKPGEKKARLIWNERYSQGGFSQVNQSANQQVLDYFRRFKDPQAQVLDLFGGSGNLSSAFQSKHQYIIDIYHGKKPSNNQTKTYIEQNLFHENALEKISEAVKKKNVDFLIVDPPRSGHQELPSFIEYFSPDKICYLSCNPSTMARDLKSSLENYKIEEIHLFDFFPGTFHVEALIYLIKK